MRPTSLLVIATLLLVNLRHESTAAEGHVYAVKFTLTSTLPFGKVPVDPLIDFAQLLDPFDGAGSLDPNSIEVVNLATGRAVPFARTEDFAYSDAGRVEWVIEDPAHLKYEIRFSTADHRPPLRPQMVTPMIGVGDLLRYNASQPRPIALIYPSRLIDLTGDGRRDHLVAPLLRGAEKAWHYAPGQPGGEQRRSERPERAIRPKQVAEPGKQPAGKQRGDQWAGLRAEQIAGDHRQAIAEQHLAGVGGGSEQAWQRGQQAEQAQHRQRQDQRRVQRGCGKEPVAGEGLAWSWG